MALTQILTTDSVSASVVNTKIVDKANTAISGLQIAQTAGGTATAITLTGIELTNGYQKTFIISASNSGSATTVNGKPLYKPGGTVAPNLVAGKSASIWYNLAGDCFFYKASAEGTATAGDVLASKTFSNDDDTGLTGTLALTGDASVGDVATGKTFYNNDPTSKLTGTGANVKKFATGVQNGSGTITGLTFRPSVVVYFLNQTRSGVSYDHGILLDSKILYATGLSNYGVEHKNTINSWDGNLLQTNEITNDGFALTLLSNSIVKWYAFE